MRNLKELKFNKKYWLLVILAAPFIFFILLLYRPIRYKPPKVAFNRQVSPYLTHELMPQLYNGAQLQEPFDLVIIQKKLNESIAQFKWPQEYRGIKFSTPTVIFVPQKIILMVEVITGGANFVITVITKPALDRNGLLNLWVVKVRVGAVNITLVAKRIAERIYFSSTKDTDPEDAGTEIAASLLYNKPFDPVFKIDDERLRIAGITVERGKMTLNFTPVFD